MTFLFPTCLWNLEKVIKMNLFLGQEQRCRHRERMGGHEKGERDELREQHWHMCIVCKIDGYWEADVQHRELSSVFCDDPERWDGVVGGRSKREGIYVYIQLIHTVVQQILTKHCKAAVVQSLNCAGLFVTTWTAAHQASLSFINSQSLFKLMSIESVFPSKHLILCGSHLLMPSIFPSIRLFSNELALHIRWPKY